MNDTITKPGFCHLCGELMPPGEEVFKYHGFSGPCPEKPLAVAKKSWAPPISSGILRALQGVELSLKAESQNWGRFYNTPDWNVNSHVEVTLTVGDVRAVAQALQWLRENA